LDDGKIVVIYPSCDPRFSREYGPGALEKVRNRYRLPDAMLVFVGGLGIHKNVATLIRAFARITRDVAHGLVVVGGMHHTSSDPTLSTLAAALGVEGRVWFLGSVPPSDLPPLYRLADLCVSPSLNEGFGLALLEAMASGTPVLASNRGGIPEVVGDAGRLIEDPLDDRALASAILDLLADPETLAQMRERGLEGSRRFNWQQTAQSTLELYGEIVHGQG
jgi:glycosyltransferase involved in cell wall biosynthesis